MTVKKLLAERGRKAVKLTVARKVSVCGTGAFMRILAGRCKSGTIRMAVHQSRMDQPSRTMPRASVYCVYAMLELPSALSRHPYVDRQCSKARRVRFQPGLCGVRFSGWSPVLGRVAEWSIAPDLKFGNRLDSGS